MELRSLVRLSTSVFALLLVAVATPQSFGRFGYSGLPTVPGFHFSPEGFRSSSDGSDTLRFARPLVGFKATDVNDRAALYSGPEVAGLPSKVRVNLRSPGFELYFPKGIKLATTTLQSPFLSWAEGSVGADVPAPASKWTLVSFHDSQSPILLVFLGPPSGLETTGSSGGWTVSSPESFSGWVRVCLPFGHYRKSGASAAALGQLVQEFNQGEALWTSPTPSLVDFEVRPDENGVTAVWTFDRPGTLVPPALVMARVGGYPVQVLSGVRNTGADLLDGPQSVTTEAKLAVRFPVLRIPAGRPLTLGRSPTDLIATVSPFDVQSLSDLALASLLGPRDRLIKDSADTVTAEFLANAVHAVETHTQRDLPFGRNGEGIDLAAAHALVQQCRIAAGEMLSEPNDLLNHVIWRRDWYTWLVWSEDQAAARRASALVAIAGTLSHLPERRLDAAMLQAGLAAERALVLYRERRGFSAVRKSLVEPLYNLRTGLFGGARTPFIDSLMSEVRIVTEEPVTAEATLEGITLRFAAQEAKPGSLVFEIGRPVTAIAVSNIKSLVATQALGRLVIEYEPNEVGECVIVLRSPGWANPLPALVSPPRYSEG